MLKHMKCYDLIETDIIILPNIDKLRHITNTIALVIGITETNLDDRVLNDQ